MKRLLNSDLSFVELDVPTSQSSIDIHCMDKHKQMTERQIKRLI